MSRCWLFLEPTSIVRLTDSELIYPAQRIESSMTFQNLAVDSQTWSFVLIISIFSFLPRQVA